MLQQQQASLRSHPQTQELDKFLCLSWLRARHRARAAPPIRAWLQRAASVIGWWWLVAADGCRVRPSAGAQ